jgi:hypothetical protein
MQYEDPLLMGDVIIGVAVLGLCGWYIITHWNDVFPK